MPDSEYTPHLDEEHHADTAALSLGMRAPRDRPLPPEMPKRWPKPRMLQAHGLVPSAADRLANRRLALAHACAMHCSEAKVLSAAMSYAAFLNGEAVQVSAATQEDSD